MKKISITKIKKAYSQAVAAFNFPYGIDRKFDEECDKSLMRFLDIIYYSMVSIFFIIPIVSITILISQKYGV